MRQFLRTLPLWVIVAGCTPSETGSDVKASKALANLGMNDVSILWPLPLLAEPSLLVPLTIGPTDAMLNDTQFDRLPQLVNLRVGSPIPPNPSNRELVPDLKVVAMRFDPCFRDKPGEGECAPQMRLVVHALQYFPPSQEASNRDIALHLFYRLSSDELREILVSLVAARAALEDPKLVPLTINPTLVSQGLSGEYAVVLKGILSRLAKSDRLVRLAFSAIGGVGNQWTFGSFDVNETGMSVVQIPNIEASDVIKMSLSSQFGAAAFSGAITPTPISGDHAATVFRFSSEQAADQIALVGTMLKIENPNLNAPGTVDCISCHIAMSARENFVNQVDIAFDFTNQFRTTWPTTVINGPVTDDKAVRAFGYISGLPAISQRVINESAAVLEALQN